MSEQTPELEEPTVEVVGPPTDDAVKAYLTAPGVADYPAEQVEQAYLAERAAQRAVCKVPADDVPWPADLAEALCRRVAANLAVRKNPSGVNTAVGEFGVSQFRVGGLDAEVRRLEGPYRKRVIG